MAKKWQRHLWTAPVRVFVPYVCAYYAQQARAQAALTRAYLKQRFTGNQTKTVAHRASVQPKAVFCFWSDTEC